MIWKLSNILFGHFQKVFNGRLRRTESINIQFYDISTNWAVKYANEFLIERGDI